MNKITPTSFRNVLILALITLISFTVISTLLYNESSLRAIFGDVFPVIVEIVAVVALFYAAMCSGAQGRRVQIAWSLIAVAVLFYAIGDITYGLLELVLNQRPFPSLADVFYLLFYPLFALGIYFLPRVPFTRRDELKLVLDLGIVAITIGLIFWIFLIVPTLSNEENVLASVISVIYIIGDFTLLLVLLRLIYSKFEEIYYGPVILLGMGVVVQILTDIIYSVQSLEGTYVSGGILDVGWVLSFILLGLGAFLQINAVKYEADKYYDFIEKIQGLKFTSYLPLIWVIISFLLLFWVNETQPVLPISNPQLVNLGVGLIVLLVVIRQFITLKENENLYLEAQNEIKSRKKAEYSLQQSEILLNAVIQGSPIPQFVIGKDHKVIYWNEALEEYSRIKSNEVIGTNQQWKAFYTEERPCMADLLVDGEIELIPKLYEGKYRKSKLIDGAYEAVDFFPQIRKEGTWLYFTAAVIKNSDGTIIGALETLEDVTERKNAEDKIKTSLKEKELLLREIHHRVKNNMQIISSLLNLQTHYVDDDEIALDILMESQNRVKSMAMIHEKLYKSQDISTINVSEYTKRLVSDLFYSYSVNRGKITPIIDVEDIKMNIETSIPCGLIINELVSNSLKYAFPDDREGELYVSLKTHNDKYELIVQDDGIGLPDDIDFEKTESLGLQLVNSLVGQLDGVIELDKRQGTSFKIIFGELEYKERI